mgnify:FL=1
MNVKSLLIGGLLPTVLLGLGTVLMKLSMREGSNLFYVLAQRHPDSHIAFKTNQLLSIRESSW